MTQAPNGNLNGQGPEEPVVEIKVGIQTLNTIIRALDELPHKISRPVIDDLGNQARAQLNIGQQDQSPPPSGPLADKVIQ